MSTVIRDTGYAPIGLFSLLNCIELKAGQRRPKDAFVVSIDLISIEI